MTSLVCFNKFGKPTISTNAKLEIRIRNWLVKVGTFLLTIENVWYINYLSRLELIGQILKMPTVITSSELMHGVVKALAVIMFTGKMALLKC